MEESPKAAQKTPSLMDRAGIIAKQVEIIDIVLSSARLSHDLRESDQVLQIEQGVHVRSRLDKIEPPEGDPWQQITAFIMCKLSGTKQDEPPNEAVADSGTGLRLEAEFALRYRLNTGEPVDDNNVEAFAKMNGVYNAWPYWREFVQSSVARMGLPPLVVGVITQQSLVKLFPADPPRATALPESKQGTLESSSSN